MKLVEKLNTALENDLSKEVFDHIRNYLICAFILALGTTEISEYANAFPGVTPSPFYGVAEISLAIVLILFNLYDGVNKLLKVKFHLVFIIILVSIYLFLSFRVVEMAWDFRVI